MPEVITRSSISNFSLLGIKSIKSLPLASFFTKPSFLPFSIIAVIILSLLVINITLEKLGIVSTIFPTKAISGEITAMSFSIPCFIPLSIKIQFPSV